MARRESGTVLALFRRSLYVRFGDAVICVGGLSLGRGPLNVLCALPDRVAWPNYGVAAGDPVRWADQDLAVGSGLRIEFKGATRWEAASALPFLVADLRSGLLRLAGDVEQRHPGGLGALIPLLCRRGSAEDGTDGPDALLLRAALPPIVMLSRWLSSAFAGSPDQPPDCSPLIGLGPGLTPSGDDFLCGAMATLYHLGERALACQLAAEVLPRAEQSGIISRSFLHSAAEGQLSDVFFDVLQNLLAGGNHELPAALSRIHVIGHTSGWDTLAGIVLVSSALCEARMMATSTDGGASGQAP